MSGLSKEKISILILLIIGGLLLAGLFVGQRVYLFGQNLGGEDSLAVLVLGQVAPGQGGQWHHAPELTDAIILTYYNPQTATVNLISLPRDLYGTFGGENFKLNEVAKRKKIEAFLDKLSEMTGVKTDKYIVVDLEVVKKVVDELGGIDIELGAPVVDPVSGYWLGAGPHHLNGDDVIWLIRNRTAPEGDFFREKNQHLVVKAIFDKLSTLDPVERTRFFFQVLPVTRQAKSNFSVGEIISELGNLQVRRFNSITLDFSTGLLQSSYEFVGNSGYAYVLIPKEGINNYPMIRQYIQARLQ